MTAPDRRSWTLEAAREMLGDVRARTEKAATELERLLAERETCAPAERAKIDVRVRGVVGTWARAMEALGLEVKGLWLVDFDNGEGYYCWKWPEEELAYFHGYEDGFAGRVRIQ